MSKARNWTTFRTITTITVLCGLGHEASSVIVGAIEHKEQKANLTPWILFLVFVLGPCEPLIPILMYPAAQSSITGLVAVTLVFALTTSITMVSVVFKIFPDVFAILRFYFYSLSTQKSFAFSRKNSYLSGPASAQNCSIH
jgi:sulfite exporter TauE/SafE